MRYSGDEIVDGYVFNGFDYDLQVWVEQGIVHDCGHPESWKNCCNERKYAGMSITEIYTNNKNREELK